MDRNDSALKRYIRSISDALPCSGKMKRQIVSQLRESIIDYLEQNPAVDFAEVQGHFGTPQQIASSYLDSEETPALLRKMSIKRKVLAIVAGATVIALLAWGGVVACAGIRAYTNLERQIEIVPEWNH